MKFNILFLFIAFIIITNPQADDDIVFQEEPEPVVMTQQPTSEVPPPQTHTSSRKFQFNQQLLYRYCYELAAVFAIFAYLIMYRRGRAHNSSLIQQFYRQTRPYFEDNFAHIGFSKNHNEDPFIAQSANEAMFYASGRYNVDYIQINFNMRKRQDLLYYLIYEIIYPEKDLITFDIPVQCDTPFVFAVASKKKFKKITQNLLDLNKLTKPFQVKNMDPNFNILGESPETIDFLFDKNVVKKIQQLSSLIMSIHYTDQKLFSEQTGHLRAVFYASKKNQEKYKAGIQLIFYIIERILNMKISSSNKQKAMKSREILNASKEKEELEKHKEELRKKKEEKKRQEEAWLRSLPPQKQKRQDEKRKKKEMNKMLKSKTMKVM